VNLAFTVWNLGRHAAQAEQKYRQQPSAEGFVEMEECRYLYREAKSELEAELDALERERAETAKSVAECERIYVTTLRRAVSR